jgi:hypothetical protein
MRSFGSLSIAALVVAATAFIPNAAVAQESACTFKQGNLSVRSQPSAGGKVIVIARACDKSKDKVGPTTYWSRL